MKNFFVCFLLVISTISNAQVAKLYRYVNTATSGHLYTTDWDELGNGKWTFKPEGISGYVFIKATSGTTPVYRYYNNTTKTHFFTANWDELGNGKWNFVYEKIAFYAFKTQVAGSVPFYRYYNQKGNFHFYTANYNELGNGRDGYTNEGITAYIFNDEASALASIKKEEYVPAKPVYTLPALSNDGAKQLLNNIRYTLEAWNNANDTYYEPAGYITANDGKVIGQNFYTFRGDSKFYTITLDWIGNTVATAKAGNNKVDIKWDNDKAATIKIEGLSDFDYTIHYNENGEIADLTYNKLFNGNLQFIRILEFNGEKLAKVTAYENNVSQKKQWIRSVKTYTYDQGETSVNFYVYATNKSNDPKNIISNMTGKYRRTDDGRFYSDAAWGDRFEVTFNQDNTVHSKKINTYQKTIEEHSYQYINNKLFSETTVITGTNGMYEKVIANKFTRTDAPATIPDQEKTLGTYKFNQQGELIWESRESVWRAKNDGIWSEWKNFTY